MTELLRQEVAAASHTVVVKVGTRVLTTAEGTLDHSRIAPLAEELSALKDSGRNVVLVSSGAAGRFGATVPEGTANEARGQRIPSLPRHR